MRLIVAGRGWGRGWYDGAHGEQSGHDAKRAGHDEQAHADDARSAQRHYAAVDHAYAEVAVERDGTHHERAHRHARGQEEKVGLAEHPIARLELDALDEDGDRHED